MKSNRILPLLAAVALAVVCSCAPGQTARTFVSDATFNAFAETYVTNLPTTMTVRNGVLRLDSGGTNLWTSSEAHDWGSYLPSGANNPAPGEAVALNLPLTLQPAGTEWACAGAYAVLSLAPGASMTALGNESAVSWTFPDGSSWRWRAESVVDVPANASGISLSYGEDGTETVNIDYSVTADAATLTLLRADTFAGVYAAVTNVVWTQLNSGTRRASVPTEGRASGFFRARVADSVPAHIEASCPVYFPGGVMTGSGDINPVIYDTVVTITAADGKTYRIPAQSLE